MGIPHKHAETIKAWAEGFDIEGGCPGKKGWDQWIHVIEPTWYSDWEYRVVNPNQEFIDAEREGKEIQCFDPILDAWFDKSANTNFYDFGRYRIKPKIKVEFDDPSGDIEDILDCFDFERVKKVMDFLDWQWYDCGVPEISDLRKKARALLNNVWNAVKMEAEKTPDKEAKYFTATGGFHAEAIKYPDSPKVYLTLNFQIEEWSNWD